MKLSRFPTYVNVVFSQLFEPYFKSFIEIGQNITVPPLGESSEIT